MTESIKVHVIDRGRSSLYLRYVDPVSGRPVEKSAKTSNVKAATKAAGQWEDELRSGRYQRPSRVTWESFVESYRRDALAALASYSAVTYEATLNVFETTCNPQRLAEVTTSKITGFVTKLREKGLAEATISRRPAALKATMRWAQRQGMLTTLPQFEMPKRAKGAKAMKGRAVTTEEFERMLAAVPKAVEVRPTTGGGDTVAAWRFYLRGLWASGLRLSESLALHWDDSPDAIVVDLSGRRPMLRIPAAAEKGNQDRLLPITPEFAALLESVPQRDRRGRVFKLLTADGKPLASTRRFVGPIVSAIGERAGVVVDERTKLTKDGHGNSKRETVRKFASAHDLRRAFGQRWAAKVMPTVLRELMRHESVETSMKFYVGQNAEATADAIWAAQGVPGPRLSRTKVCPSSK